MILNKNKVKILIPSYLENLTLLRAMIRVYLQTHKVDLTDEVQILSVIDELVTNAIEHGYEYDRKGEIKIVLNIYKKTIFLTIEDSGKGYDETINDSKEDGGFGLFIVKKLVDVFKIEKKKQGTIFRIEKKLKEAV